MPVVKKKRILTLAEKAACARARGGRVTTKGMDDTQRGGRKPPPVTLPAWAERIRKEMKDDA